MWIDRARIRVTGGKGGNGCCSFRREKYVPRGGPDGGDGGNGGDVFIVADARLSSLLDLRYHAHWKGERGLHGEGKNRHGKNGGEITIRVPAGTVVHDAASGDVLCDLAQVGDRFLAAAGGRGGKGNARFTSSTNRAPKFAELGEPGQEADYVLELKLIAEVGLVGLPNAGKSTLLSRVTAATPKIADYPFTTLSPNLGVAELSDHRALTIADIPGIIEGAAQGKGLGHDFLRHIERTKVLLFLIDLGDEDPVATWRTLERELAAHSVEFADRPAVFALNKADIPANCERFPQVAEAFETSFMISAATGEGVGPLLEHLWAVVERVRQEEAEPENIPVERTYTYEAPFTVEKTAAGFRVEGRQVHRAVRMTDFDNEEAVHHLQHRLKGMGLFKVLKRLGAQAGQTIVIGDVELEYHPD